MERPRDWYMHLTPLLFALHKLAKDSTQFSPFKLLHSKTVRDPYLSYSTSKKESHLPVTICSISVTEGENKEEEEVPEDTE